jgi:hypothetical protein
MVVTNLQPWFKSPRVSIFDKSSLLRITIYGPYSGNYTKRLEDIASSLRHNKLSDAYLIKDRNDFRKRSSNESQDEYFTNKSYYYLEHSHVNFFVLYCKAHGEGVAMELQYTCQTLRSKTPCCAVIKDISCKMSSMIEGQIRITKLLVDEFDGNKKDCDNQIIRFMTARCVNFLTAKFDLI